MKKFSLFSILTLLSLPSLAASNSYYCQEVYVADSPAWKLEFVGRNVRVSGNVWSVDPTNNVTINLVHANYNRHPSPIGSFYSLPQNFSINLNMIDVVNSRPSTTVYSGFIEYRGKRSQISCWGRPMGIRF